MPITKRESEVRGSKRANKIHQRHYFPSLVQSLGIIPTPFIHFNFLLASTSFPKMVNKKLLLAFSLFCSTAYSINMIWIDTAYSACNQCLDQTFSSCPGSYRTASYAQCMCKGDGGVNLVTCVSVCDSVDRLGTNLGSQQVSGWYGYCTIFFQDMCSDAQPFIYEDSWDKNCNADSPSSTTTL